MNICFKIMSDQLSRTEDCLKSEREVKHQLVEEKKRLENEVMVLKEEILHLKVLVPEDKQSLKGVPSEKKDPRCYIQNNNIAESLVPGNSSKEQMSDLSLTPQKNEFQVSEFLNASPIFRRGRGCRKQSNVTEGTNEVAEDDIISDTEGDDSVSLLSMPRRKEEVAEEEVKEQKSADPPVKKSKYNDVLCDQNKPSFCHVGSSVRTKERRKKMPGFECRECSAYYSMKMEEGLDTHQIHSLINKCSRHRAHHKPSKTPEKFWDADIIEGDPDSPRNKSQQGPPLKNRAMRREAWRKLNFGH